MSYVPFSRTHQLAGSRFPTLLNSDSPPPYYNGTSNETLPLKGAPRSQSRSVNVIYIILVAIVFGLCFHAVDDYYNTDRPSVRARKRALWEQEQRDQELAFNETRRGWEVQRLNWLDDFAAEKDRLRRAWNDEDVLAREVRRQEKIEWEEQASAWRQSFNATRTRWLQQLEEEKASAQKQLDRLREEQARQRQKHDLERGTWERELEKRKEAARLDTERRLRAYLTWRALTPHQECISYGTRMYEAELMNVPADADGLAWCRDTAIQIHSVNYQRPAYCSRATDAQKIMGYWRVSSNEPTCTTFWESFSDHGCLAAGSGQRRYEAQLGNHQWPWGNWKEMCATTPATFNGMRFDSPHMCENRGKRGIYGIWLSRDEHC